MTATRKIMYRITQGTLVPRSTNVTILEYIIIYYRSRNPKRNCKINNAYSKVFCERPGRCYDNIQYHIIIIL